MGELARTESITLANRAHALQQEQMTRQIPKFSILATMKFVAAA
jgi:hypothetical protein